MQRLRTWTAALGLLGAALVASTSATAQNYGDAPRGAALAMRLCQGCHGVRPREVSINALAPSFDWISETRGMTGTALSVALRTHHRDMPNIMLEDQERADIIAYIMTLKSQ